MLWLLALFPWPTLNLPVGAWLAVRSTKSQSQ
jgi:hypothetical protein